MTCPGTRNPLLYNLYVWVYYRTDDSVQCNARKMVIYSHTVMESSSDEEEEEDSDGEDSESDSEPQSGWWCTLL